MCVNKYKANYHNISLKNIFFFFSKEEDMLVDIILEFSNKVKSILN